MMMKTFTALLTITAATLSLQAAQTSFDCKKAANVTEHFVCRDKELAALDRKMAQTYSKAENSYLGNEMESLKAEQRSWIKKRNHCKASKPCLAHVYQKRITQLQVEGGLVQNEAADNVTYTCVNGGKLSAVYYNNTEIPAVFVSMGKFQALMYLTESGSGGKYQADRNLFWEHHGEGKANWSVMSRSRKLLKHILFA